MAILLFIAKLIVSSGLLYGYYHLFLRNKRFHRYNRFYLLTISLIALIIPLIKIPVYFFTGNQQHNNLIKTLKVITASGWEEPVIIYARQNQWSKLITIQNGLFVVYLAGLVTGLIIITRSIFYIAGLTKKYECETVDQLKIYNTTEPGTPFSFFRSIFWDKKISLTGNQGQQIFRHELFHVKEKHSADILLMEILGCICWFNPFYYLIKKELRAIHEFLADEYAVSANNRYDYAELLVLHAISNKAPAITHPFFHNQIKRRIIMITQSNLIRRNGYISRIMALPLLFILVSAFAVKLTKKTINPIHFSATKKMTVVIDAGHGGIFPGINNGKTVLEKDINLGIAQKIKELAPEYNVIIVLTRNNDHLVGNATTISEDLLNRVKIGREANADLFISVHVNADQHKTTTQSGFEAYISKRNEHPKDREIASTILTSLKDIYTVDDVIQQREIGIVVLDKSICPSVCIECGYLNNPKDAAFIIDEANQEKIARKILEGIVKYSNAQTAGATMNKPGLEPVDTLSPENFSKISPDDIKSLDVVKSTNLVTIHYKNGKTDYAYIKEVNDYYTANHLDTVPKTYRVNINAKDDRQTIIFTKVEVESEFPGGQQAWSNYLFKTLKYPQPAINANKQGTVVIQFIVDTDGKISDVEAISGPKELQAESIRVIKESGNWVSAVQNGKKVKSYKRQPITFKLA